MTVTPEISEVIAEAIESALIDVHVALPGAVQSYSASDQTAVIQLQLKRMLPKEDGTYVTEDLPVLENVPILFPRNGNFIVTFPIMEGDTGLVIFSEMSLDQWRSKGENTSPGDIGRHTLTGAVFIPGLVPNAEAISDDVSADLVVGQIGGVQVRIKPGGACEVVSGGGPDADDFVAQAGKVQSEISAMLQAGVSAGGTGAANFTAAKTYWDSTSLGVASSNLKADD